jgi:acetylglutamate kinase
MSESTENTELEGVADMSVSNTLRANVLTEALPYIQKYANKVVVVKYGGNAMINGQLKDAVMGDIVLLSLIGIKVVLIHGGGPEITEVMNKMGKETVFVNGLRVTDHETMEIALMVLAGKINKHLAGMIGKKGGRAVGLCGIDGGIIQAKQLSEKLGFVGEVTEICSELITDLLEKGYIPVISTIGCDIEGQIYNINADTAAAKIAGELKAESLILMTDTSGILMDQEDPSSFISKITTDELHMLVQKGIITEGMIPKAECCIDAIDCGVNKVFIIDGRIPHSILIEILTDEGVGTMVVPE